MKIDSVTSAQIKYSRVLCIYFMIIVHIPPWLQEAYIPSFFEPIKIVFYDILGRSSVTALSCISGFLLFFVVSKKSWTSIIFSRFKNLILPMAFWNCVTILFSVLVFYGLGKVLPALSIAQSTDYIDVFFNGILAVNYQSASGVLAFLRDLFVCAVLSVPLAMLIKKFHWVSVLILIAIYLSFTFEPIVMRGSILLGFATGMLIAQEFGHLTISKHLRITYAIGFIGVCLIEFGFFSTFYQYDLIKRLILSLMFIDMGYFLSKKVGVSKVDNLASSAYLVYLSHGIAFLIFWGVWNILIGNTITPVYLLFFFFAPLIWFATVRYSIGILRFLPSWGQILVAGKNYRNTKSIKYSD